MNARPVLYSILGLSFFVFTQPGHAEKTVPVHIEETVLRPALPASFFSFNVNYFNFQREYVDPESGRVADSVINLLRPFRGAYYRYPGGTLANTFDWRSAIGPYNSRKSVKPLKWAEAQPVRFGLDEYRNFLESVGGRPWFVLNLVGTEEQHSGKIPSDSEMAASNKELARYYARLFPGEHHYQLGNELDRSHYEWDIDRYVSRSLATMSAITGVDPGARFVPFLRDFDWRYRTRPGYSPGPLFSATVMKLLPDVRDFSLQIYYDTPSEEGKKSDIAWRERLIKRTISEVKEVKKDSEVSVWITEHARANPRPQTPNDIEHTSGIDGAISSADFIIAMTQVPEIQGMFWHALGGGKWQLIKIDEGGSASTTPMYVMLKLLREHVGGGVLKTRCGPESDVEYVGGYEVRATAFKDGQDGLSVWAVNRGGEPKILSIQRRSFAGRSMAYNRNVLTTGKHGALSSDLSTSTSRVVFDAKGNGNVNIPAKSVAVFTFN